MNRKIRWKNVSGISLYFTFLLLSSIMIISCDNPTMPDDDETQTEEETDSTEDQESDDTEEEELEICEETNGPPEEFEVEQESGKGPIEITESTGDDPEEITEDPEEPEEEEMKLQPIEEYGAYAVCEGGKVYGLTGTGMIPVVLKDSKDNEFPFSKFYKDGGILYFSVQFKNIGEAIPVTDPVEYEAIDVEEFYKQEDEKVTKIKAFPEIPESERVEMDDEPFKIVNTKSGKVDCSFVYQGEQPTGYIVIDGYYKTDEGLWFSVPESYGNPVAKRLRGLYFFHLDGNIQTVGEYGRVF